MDREKLSVYLKKKGHSKAAIERTIWAVDEFEKFLALDGRSLESGIESSDLQGFLKVSKKQPKNLLYGLTGFFDYIGREDLKQVAGVMRSEMLDKDRKPLLLRELVGVDPGLLGKLAEKGIRNANQLLAVSHDHASREELANSLGVGYQELLDMVKMADLSRLFSVKTTRTRLYLDSGFDTLDKLAAQSPEGLVDALKKFVAETNFPGIATLPKEALCTIETAKKLERKVEYLEEE